MCCSSFRIRSYQNHSNLQPDAPAVPVSPGKGVRYVCPQRIVADGGGDVTLYFRTTVPGRGSLLRCTAADGTTLASAKRPRTSPGTMESLTIPKETAASLSGPVEVSCEHEETLA